MFAGRETGTTIGEYRVAEATETDRSVHALHVDLAVDDGNRRHDALDPRVERADDQ